jgi:hypothetical protein
VTANSSVFSRLLVSAPNGGGLFAVSNGEVHQIDDLSTTGLSLSGGHLARSIQPNSLRLYRAGEAVDINLDEQLGDVHDVLQVGDEYFVVGTQGNTVGKLLYDGTVQQRWSLGGKEDSHHVNCLTVWRDRVVYSAFGDFETSRGYKSGTAGTGYVKDLLSGETIVRGLSQPHSLTSVGHNLVLADSENQQIVEFDTEGRILRSRPLGGYPRGICVSDDLIYVGLSADRHDGSSQTNASIVALNAATWDLVGRISIPSREIYSLIFCDSPAMFVELVMWVSCDSASRIASRLAEHSSTVIAYEQQRLVI